jgi:hypothetical protein
MNRNGVRLKSECCPTEIGISVRQPPEYARNAAALAIGGFIAYAGLLVILVGLRCLLAWAFENAGLSPTENRMGETLDDLGRRLSPSHINAQVKRRIQANPYQSGLIAMGAGLVSALFLKRKHRHV